MRFYFLPALLGLLGFVSPGSANVANYGPSTQSITLTGLGGNAQGEGVSSVIWGSCVYDGKNTKCTVSAPYTGEGNGGTIALVITYPGNGPAPITATSISPGSDFVNLSLTAGSFLVTLTDADGTATTYYEAPNWNFIYSNPTCTDATPCGVGNVGLTVGATITGPVTGSFDTTPIIAHPQGVISASAYGGFSVLAPGDWMEIYGYNLATVLTQVWAGSDFKNNVGPTALGGTTVTIGGQAAFIDFVSPGQVNAQVPSGVASGLQPVVVTTAGGSSDQFMMQVNATEPGLLAPGSFKGFVGAVFPDGKTFVLPPQTIPGLPSKRAAPGDVITFYGVGFGPVTPDIPAGLIVSQSNTLTGKFAVSFGGVPATVQFSGLTGGYLGLYQFNVKVPNVPASDSVPVTFTLDGVAATQTLKIAIGN